jgi:hypothetical protein
MVRRVRGGVRHGATLAESRPVVSVERLQYSFLSPDLIRFPFRVVGATGAGSLFPCMTIDDESVDSSERKLL